MPIIDPVTSGEVVVGGALLTQILGPTAAYLGDELKDLTAKRIENFKRIAANAANRLGDGLKEPGSVPPRVLKEVYDEGTFWDEELGTDYFGGILAASRTGNARDDRGASLAQLVGRLSTYQLRTHYLLYAAARGKLIGSDDVQLRVGPHDLKRFFMPYEDWWDGMDLSTEEWAEWGELAGHSLRGLARENLIHGTDFMRNDPDGLRSEVQFDGDFGKVGGIVYSITLQGIELFIHAHGLRGDFTGHFVSHTSVFDLEADIRLPGATYRLSEVPRLKNPSEEPPTAFS